MVAYRAWLDEDGRHVWIEHTCTIPSYRVTKLPYGEPEGWMADAEGNVRPSVHCLECGFHEMIKVGPKP